MQRFMKISFIRNHLFHRAVDQFMQEQAERGIQLRSEDIPERLCEVKTVLIDAPLVMEGNNAVRQVAAPLEICPLSRLKHQSAWMVLTAGVALGCKGYAPLENFARDMNFAHERMARQYPQVDCIPYDHRRGMETTVHRDADGLRAYAKGDPETILDACTHILNGREREMEAGDRAKALLSAREMEAAGLQTLAFATRWMEAPGAYEEDMVFLGIVGMGDLPREDAPWAMEALRGAGVRPVFVAGEECTAGAVSASGVLRREAGIMEVAEMDALNDMYLSEAAAHVDAFVGVDWTRKVRLSKALRTEGLVATVSPEPQSGGIVLALGGGGAADVVIEGGGLDAVVRLLGDCRALLDAYKAG